VTVSHAGGQLSTRYFNLEGDGRGKLLSPARRREAVCHAQATFSVSERRACRVVGQCRATPQYVPTHTEGEDRLRIRIIELAREYGRYGYRRITALLHQEGWQVNHKHVARIRRQEGLSAAETTQTGQALVGRWLLYPPTG